MNWPTINREGQFTIPVTPQLSLSMVPGRESRLVDVEKGRFVKPGYGERDRSDDADHDHAEHDR
jgi:hypothetical protein